MGKPYKTFDEVKTKLMQNPAFRDEYERTQPFAAIALEILRVRTESGLTQKELAEKVGTNQPVIARIESLDYGRVSIQTLVRIAQALNLKLKIEFESVA